MLETFQSALLIGKMKLDQWKSRSEIKETQEDRLRELIPYAADNVQFYKNHRIRCIDDLQGLPIVDKNQIQGNHDLFLSKRYDKSTLKVLHTSGSTGKPLGFYLCKSDEMHRGAILSHAYIEAGLGILDRVAFITYDIQSQAPSTFFNYRLLSMFERERKNLSKLKEMKPSILRSYPSVLMLLAHRNLEENIGFSVKKAFSGAEVLSDHARSLISRSFDCEVRNFYGAVETGRIAWECEEGSMHIPASIVAEVVDGHGNHLREGKCGDLVLTPLHQHAMPLIRYRIGDMAALGPKCKCGRGLQVLKKIEGRRAALLTMRSGRICNSLALDIYMRTIPGILVFHAVQEEPGQLSIKVLPEGKPSEKIRDMIVEKLQSCFPEPMNIDIEIVDSVPRGGSGKVQAVVSKVKVEM